MRKPIEPGCIARVIGLENSNRKLNGTIVTVLKETSTFTMLPSKLWDIDSIIVRQIVNANSVYRPCISENKLQRIDDGDFDPTAEDEENPYTMSAPNVRAPARQV